MFHIQPRARWREAKAEALLDKHFDERLTQAD